MQGLAHFPGIDQLVAASVSMTHGISPGVATLVIAPQSNFTAEVGTLTLTYGSTTIEWIDCKVDYSTLERNASGQIWRLSLLDRRWKWRFGHISGSYNVRRDDFGLQNAAAGAIDTERTPRQLAALCLDAMGETDYDVSDLPNDTRPGIEWDATNPAQALAQLCDDLGCRVVLQLDNRVALRLLGVGAALPTEAVLDNALTVNPPELPDAVTVLGSEHRYQVDFHLEAVGLEEGSDQGDDTLKPIEQLSYRPSSGWSRVDLPHFHQVAPAFRPLAAKSVFRYYRIKTPVAIPGYTGAAGNQVDHLEQLLPIEDELVAVATENGQLANRPALVFGVWFADQGGMANTAASLAPIATPNQSDGGSTLSTIYQRPYAIDVARGLVIFEEPVFRNTHASATGGAGYEVVRGEAQLVLRATCGVRDPESSIRMRYSRTRSTGGNFGTPTRCVPRDDLVVTHLPQYNALYGIDSVQSNAAAIDAAADAWLDLILHDYQTRTPQTAHYAGLVPLDLDGAIQHVSYHVSTAGTTTAAARDNELSSGLWRYHGRRRIERQDMNEERQRRLTARHVARICKSSSQTKPRLSL